MSMIHDSNLPATESPDMQKNPVKWHCKPKICKITRQAISGVTNLFKSISSLPRNHYSSFYHHLDDCSNPAQTDRMGHTLHCMPDSQCCKYPASSQSRCKSVSSSSVTCTPAVRVSFNSDFPNANSTTNTCC